MILLRIFIGLILIFTTATLNLSSVFAQTTIFNKHGIHLASATKEEAEEAAKLVNSNGGDWGFVTVVIQSDDRKHDKWQNFFNELRKLHLVPIIRLATKNENGYWERPYDKEHEAWADFLDGLIWPVKTRYVVIYNEPNHGLEWGNSSDPENYAQTLNSTIDALKNKSEDFFVLNAGFDASAPHRPQAYFDEELFIKEMISTVPDIFNKLDGWASHSYPAPNFSGSPTESGRGTVKTYEWEINLLKSLGVNKDLPVFITETGWKHSEGIDEDRTLLPGSTVADYFKTAYEIVWNDPKIIAVTPFILNYQDKLFDHFSFKKVDPLTKVLNVLGDSTEDYYPHFKTIQDLSKLQGKPVQQNLAFLEKVVANKQLVVGKKTKIQLTFKNLGQSIWNETNNTYLTVLQKSNAKITTLEISQDTRVEPGNSYSFEIEVTPTQTNQDDLTLIFFNGENSYDNEIEKVSLFAEPNFAEANIINQDKGLIDRFLQNLRFLKNLPLINTIG